MTLVSFSCYRAERDRPFSKEGKEKNQIHMVGNTMIDSLVNFNDAIQKATF